MNSFGDAVQAAMITRLAAVTLAPVFAVVPDGHKPPAVVISDSIGEQIGGKGSDAERHEVTIRSVVAGTSKKALSAVMQQVKAALHNQPLTAAGFVISPAVLTSSSEARDPDEGVLIGTQQFLAFVQAA
jgi:hypothetical protein